MSAQPAPVFCPSCGGVQMAGHPAGYLALDHRVTCALRDAEDARRAADEQTLQTHVVPRDPTDPTRPAPGHTLGPEGYTRPATPAELILLGGDAALQANVTTLVVPVTRGITRRSWPALGIE